MPIIQNLSFAIGKKQILRDITFTFELGKTYLLLGPNGAGKSTLFELMLGLSIPTHGSIDLQVGKDKVGFCGQSIGLPRDFSVQKNLKTICQLKGVDFESFLHEMRALVGEHLRTKTSKLSTGWRQRLNIATTLLPQNELLIFDEPSNGLDLDGKFVFLDYLNALKAKGKTLLISSHNASEFNEIYDECVFIKDGQLVKSLSKSELEDSFNSLEEAYKQLQN